MGNSLASNVTVDTSREKEKASEQASSMPPQNLIGTRPYIGDIKDPGLVCTSTEWEFLRHCQLGDLDRVKAMLEDTYADKVDVNLDIPMFASPLGLALSSRKFDVAEFLCSKGAKLCDQFHQFANSGDTLALCWLFSQGGMPANMTQCVALAYSNGYHDLAFLFRSLGGQNVTKSYMDMQRNGEFIENYA